MKFKKFLKECHEKEVFKKLSLYIVTSWLLIQVLDTTWEALGLPKESVTILLIILLAGFPVNVYLVWRFDLAKQESPKIKIDKDGLEIKRKPKPSPFQKTYFSVLTALSILTIAIVAVIVNNNFVRSVSIEPLDVSDKIAVETFGNNTGDPENDIIGKMAADWIIHGISENNIGQVISQKTIDDYTDIVVSTVSPSKSKNLLRDYFKPGKIITGNFYQKDDKLLFQGSLIDAKKNDEHISFKLIECNAESPLDCIEQLKQLILGYLIIAENQLLSMESTPPKFDAYQHMITARANVRDNDIYIKEVEKAIAVDPNYFEPKLLEIVFYYNRGNFHKSDSLLSQIRPNSNTTARQLNLLNMYRSLLEGNNRKVYNYGTKEYGYNLFDIEMNQSLMIFALQFINRPDLLDGIFEEIDSEGFIIENCLYCEYRIYAKSLADIQLKRYDQAIALLEGTIKKIDAFYLNKPLASAYIRSNKNTELDELASRLELTLDIEELNQFYLFVGSEYLLKKNKLFANKYFNKIIRNGRLETNNALAESYYFIEDFKNAEVIYQSLHNINPKEISYISRLASCLTLNEKIEQGEQMIQKLEDLREGFQYGKVDYFIAQYHAATRNEDQMFSYLLKSISQGNHYTISSFQNDPHFINYLANEKFKSILTYWQ